MVYYFNVLEIPVVPYQNYINNNNYNDNKNLMDVILLISLVCLYLSRELLKGEKDFKRKMRARMRKMIREANILDPTLQKLKDLDDM